MTDLYDGGPSLQELIDRGAWGLEGSAGRAMMGAIEAGECRLGPKPVRDFWGNLVPAWWMVDPGSKGSPEFAGLEPPDEPEPAEKSRLLEAVGLDVPAEVFA